MGLEWAGQATPRLLSDCVPRSESCGENLEGSDQGAKESNSIIRCDHQGPFIDVSREE